MNLKRTNQSININIKKCSVVLFQMVTLMIGTNDICSDQCYSNRQGTETHRRNLIEVLDYLKENMPRTLVNLVSMPCKFPVLVIILNLLPVLNWPRIFSDIPAYADLVDPPFATCITMKLVACSCLFGGVTSSQKLQTVRKMTRQFQRIQQEIVSSFSFFFFFEELRMK